MDDDRSFPYQIRDLTTDDLDQYNALLRYAFQVTEKQLMETGWRDDEIMQSKFPILERADVLGCYDGDELVSQIAVYPLQMNVHDEIYPIGYVTSVNTYPEYSGRGLIRTLMHRSLTRMREKGQSVALLYPYSIPMYRRFGWEIISNKISYKIKDNQIYPQQEEGDDGVRQEGRLEQLRLHEPPHTVRPAHPRVPPEERLRLGGVLEMGR